MYSIIDSHVHYWLPAQLRYGWLADLPVLNKPVLTDTIPQGDVNRTWQVEQIVFVQADCAAEQGLAEAQWVTSLAAQDPRIKGIVAFAPLEQGPDAVRMHLAALKHMPLVKGVRRLIQAEPLGFSTQPAFVEAVAALADFDFTFDLCIKRHQLEDVIKLVEQCDRVNFVLDHIGKPAIAEGTLDPWREQIEILADFPNVLVKLSGLIPEAGTSWTTEQLFPYVAHVFTTFGPQRVMFGSDSPVYWLQGCDYPTWVAEVLKLAAGSRLRDHEIDALFHWNTKYFYGL